MSLESLRYFPMKIKRRRSMTSFFCEDSTNLTAKVQIPQVHSSTPEKTRLDLFSCDLCLIGLPVEFAFHCSSTSSCQPCIGPNLRRSARTQPKSFSVCTFPARWPQSAPIFPPCKTALLEILQHRWVKRRQHLTHMETRSQIKYSVSTSASEQWQCITSWRMEAVSRAPSSAFIR